jgi:hypothetical protein
MRIIRAAVIRAKITCKQVHEVLPSGHGDACGRAGCEDGSACRIHRQAGAGRAGDGHRRYWPWRTGNYFGTGAAKKLMSLRSARRNRERGPPYVEDIGKLM